MKEIKLTKRNYTEVLNKAYDVLFKGGSVIYPTETSYGLGVDFNNEKAVNNVYTIKQRDDSKPLSVLMPDLTYALVLLDFNSLAYKLALKCWPGSLTIILPFKNKSLDKYDYGNLAIRVSSNEFASDLVSKLGNPLVSTSANISNNNDCYTPQDIKKQFKDKKNTPDLFINVGVLNKKKPSTIIKCDNNKLEVLRKGEIKVKI